MTTPHRKANALRFVFTEWMNRNPLNSPNLSKIVNIKNNANRKQQLNMMGRHLTKKSRNLNKDINAFMTKNITKNNAPKLGKLLAEQELVLFYLKRIGVLLRAFKRPVNRSVKA